MKSLTQNGAFLVCLLCLPLLSYAGQPEVGRDAAAKYFGAESAPKKASSDEGGTSGHYLALHLGRFTQAVGWGWGPDSRTEGLGASTMGVTYRMHEWSNSMDLSLRVDFNEYKVAGEKPYKMSLLPLLTFPESSARFPLYFGIGAGLGVFFKQIKDESSVSFDYQLLMGARFFDVFENTGFFIETGLKNHLLVGSDGQLNGTFVAAGAVFTF